MILMADIKKEVKPFSTEETETTTTVKEEKKERPNNTNLGLQMTGLQTAEGKTVSSNAEFAEVTEAERKKTQETLTKQIKENQKQDKQENE